jgi:hypothetical protein
MPAISVCTALHAIRDDDPSHPFAKLVIWAYRGFGAGHDRLRWEVECVPHWRLIAIE